MQEVRELKAEGAVILFFSYECLQYERVAPNEVQLKAMQATIWEASRMHNTTVDKVYAWLDCFSIPQSNRFLQKAAINAIYGFASAPSVFVIVCPQSTHANTLRVANDESIKGRFWCRLEQVAFFCRQGRNKMFLHRGTKLDPLPADWLDSVCCVYDSITTCCRLQHATIPDCDREKAVLPLLALYHDVYERHSAKDSPKSQEDTDVWELIQRHKTAMFPTSFAYNYKGERQHRTLFGQMIERIELMLQSGVGEESIDISFQPQPVRTCATSDSLRTPLLDASKLL